MSRATNQPTQWLHIMQPLPDINVSYGYIPYCTTIIFHKGYSIRTDSGQYNIGLAGYKFGDPDIRCILLTEYKLLAGWIKVSTGPNPTLGRTLESAVLDNFTLFSFQSF